MAEDLETESNAEERPASATAGQKKPQPAGDANGFAAAAQTRRSLFEPSKIQSIKIRVQAILGGLTLTVQQLSELEKGEVLSLDSRVGSPIEIVANGQVIAQGEIIVIEEEPPRFGVQITQLMEVPN